MLNGNVSCGQIWQNSWDKVGRQPFASFHSTNTLSNIFKVHHSHPNTNLSIEQIPSVFAIDSIPSPFSSFSPVIPLSSFLHPCPPFYHFSTLMLHSPLFSPLCLLLPLYPTSHLPRLPYITLPVQFTIVTASDLAATRPNIIPKLSLPFSAALQSSAFQFGTLGVYSLKKWSKIEPKMHQDHLYSLALYCIDWKKIAFTEGLKIITLSLNRELEGKCILNLNYMKQDS